jgi:hypothetical protein
MRVTGQKRGYRAILIRISGIDVGAGLSFLSVMPVNRKRHCWRRDLLEFRGLTKEQRSVFLPVLEWFENFRVACGLDEGGDAVEAFWRKEVEPKDRPREPWQLKQWENALHWYLKWLDACAEEGAGHRSLPERAKAALRSAGARLGLSPSTTQCYGLWAERYATFAKGERAMRRLETANRFLTSVLNDGHSAYPTQKQALNALTFYFRHSCGVADPVFDVKLKRAN